LLGKLDILLGYKRKKERGKEKKKKNPSPLSVYYSTSWDEIRS